MTLQNANNLHLLFNAAFRQLRCHGGAGEFHWSLQARGEGEFSDQKRKNGDTPYGRYWCGIPEAISTGEEKSKSLGPWFIPLEPEAGVAPGRTDLGLHGGGSGRPAPLADYQGWETTYGCIRVQNADLPLIVRAIDFTSGRGGSVLLTVSWTAVWNADALKYVPPQPPKKPKDVARRAGAKP